LGKKEHRCHFDGRLSLQSMTIHRYPALTHRRRNPVPPNTKGVYKGAI